MNNAAACFYLPYDQVSDAPVRGDVRGQRARAVGPEPGGAARDVRGGGEGWILNISSVVAEHPAGPPFPTFHVEHGATLYGVSKAALERLTTGLAAEVSPYGVAVNSLAPVAAVATPGAVAMGLVPADPAHVEPVEQMAEAAVALCTLADLTGRVDHERRRCCASSDAPSARSTAARPYP